ncbi:HEAT repeat domain-containing protein [Streptomyces sp. NPDC001651]|uniref:HEAT repeat domain-containing protein n=1 Tax=Streptomyces sp. NPDC001651 TaxID=3364596 RepID=UPI0036B60F3D
MSRPLVDAVRAGDHLAVMTLVDDGADPDTPGADGLPLLCEAVAAFDSPVAGVLVEGGADPDRVLPDGTTPLWRAVDSGSPALVTAVLGREPRLRLAEAARERLLALARNWHETGVADELRRRTGASGPVETVRVDDDADGFNFTHQMSLAGQSVRDGHAGILTALEWAFRILTPVDEIIARAVAQPDEDHATWWEVLQVLLDRRSEETWSAVVSHRHHPDPAHRRFVAEYVRVRGVVADDSPRARREGDFVSAWAAEETDPAMLERVLRALDEYEHPGREAAALRYAAHPDVVVRRVVPLLLFPFEDALPMAPEARRTLCALLHDPDAEVRLGACRVAVRHADLLPEAVQQLLRLAEDSDPELHTPAASHLASCPDRTPAVADALAALLERDDPPTVREAGYGLALRDDARTAEAYHRIRSVGAVHEDDHRWSAIWQWAWDNGLIRPVG